MLDTGEWSEAAGGATTGSGDEGQGESQQNNKNLKNCT